MRGQLALPIVASLGLLSGCGGSGEDVGNTRAADGLHFGVASITPEGAEPFTADFIAVTDEGRLTGGFASNEATVTSGSPISVFPSGEDPNLLTIQSRGGAYYGSFPATIATGFTTFDVAVGDDASPTLFSRVGNPGFFQTSNASGTRLPNGSYTGVFAARGSDGGIIELGQCFAQATDESLGVSGDTIFSGTGPRADGTFRSAFADAGGGTVPSEAKTRKADGRFLLSFTGGVFEGTTTFVVLKPVSSPADRSSR